MDSQADRLWTVTELADFLRFSPRTVATFLSKSPDRLPPRVAAFARPVGIWRSHGNGCASNPSLLVRAAARGRWSCNLQDSKKPERIRPQDVGGAHHRTAAKRPLVQIY